MLSCLVYTFVDFIAASIKFWIDINLALKFYLFWLWHVYAQFTCLQYIMSFAHIF